MKQVQTKNHILLQVDSKWEKEVESQRLKQAILTTLELEQIRDEVSLSLVIVGDEEMTRLHKSYRGESGTTDVLTFAYQDDGELKEMRGYLGDIIVSYEQAKRQASDEGHKVQEELELLAVHGTLHLLGYNDENPTDAYQAKLEKEKMWLRQHQVMQTLGLGNVAPSLHHD